MPDQNLIDGLAALFQETGQAHHQAFLSTDGEDPGWAKWYADYAHDRVEALLDIAIPESQLAQVFEDVEEQRQRKAPDAAWARYYAEFFAERFGDGE